MTNLGYIVIVRIVKSESGFETQFFLSDVHNRNAHNQMINCLHSLFFDIPRFFVLQFVLFLPLLHVLIEIC